MLRNKIALTAAGFVAGAAMTFATFGPAALPVGADQAENAYLLAQKGQVSATTFQLDKSSFHDIDVQANEQNTIMPGALGNVRRARIATEATDWPAGLKPQAAELVTAMKSLETAIRTEDAAQVAGPAKQVHDVAHDLSTAVYTWLETGKAPEAGHGHGH